MPYVNDTYIMNVSKKVEPPSSLYPVLMTDKVAETAEFYRSKLGFETSFEADWYVSLRHKDAPQHQIAVLRCDHPSVPEGFRHTGRGLLINIEVADARAEYRRLIEGGELPVHLELRDESWGQRHFITSDPSGNLVDIIQNIAPSQEYADAYVGGVLES